MLSLRGKCKQIAFYYVKMLVKEAVNKILNIEIEEVARYLKCCKIINNEKVASSWFEKKRYGKHEITFCGKFCDNSQFAKFIFLNLAISKLLKQYG